MNRDAALALYRPIRASVIRILHGFWRRARRTAFSRSNVAGRQFSDFWVRAGNGMPMISSCHNFT
jgi:hypothetical protein